jgi:hypothetical protein
MTGKAKEVPNSRFMLNNFKKSVAIPQSRLPIEKKNFFRYTSSLLNER